MPRDLLQPARSVGSLSPGYNRYDCQKVKFSDIFRRCYNDYFCVLLFGLHFLHGIKHQFKHHLFYRQCMLFVRFLERENPCAFKRFITDIESKMDFSDAFHLAFGTDIMSAWDEFKIDIRPDCGIREVQCKII